mmetsp:Transcript_82470/g.237083  ORF Transcript_82470/g.237083 Transcript_82470/m.237083 type:complete len:204 (-) Transcript_82470:491-1102(-)
MTSDTMRGFMSRAGNFAATSSQPPAPMVYSYSRTTEVSQRACANQICRGKSTSSWPKGSDICPANSIIPQKINSAKKNPMGENIDSVTPMPYAHNIKFTTTIMLSRWKYWNGIGNFMVSPICCCISRTLTSLSTSPFMTLFGALAATTVSLTTRPAQWSTTMEACRVPSSYWNFIRIAFSSGYINWFSRRTSHSSEEICPFNS